MFHCFNMDGGKVKQSEFMLYHPSMKLTFSHITDERLGIISVPFIEFPDNWYQ